MSKLKTNEFGIPNIVIPAEVYCNPELKTSDKILLGIIYNLTNNSYGYCWASNKYLSIGNTCSISQVSKAIARLEKKKYIYTELGRKKSGGQTIRKIFINQQYQKTYYKLLEKTHQSFEDIKYDDDDSIIPTPKKGTGTTNVSSAVRQTSQRQYAKRANNIDSTDSKYDLDSSKSKIYTGISDSNESEKQSNNSENSSLGKNTATKKRRRKKPSISSQEENTDQGSKTTSASMTQKAKQKASQKKPKSKNKSKKQPSKLEELPGYTNLNHKLLQLWNETRQKHFKNNVHKLKPTKRIEKIFQKLNWLRKGEFGNHVVRDDRYPDEIYSKRYSQKELKDAIGVQLPEALRQGNWPTNKKFLYDLSFDSFLYSDYNHTSPFIQFQHYGVTKLYDPMKELVNENQREAFRILSEHFDEYSNFNKSRQDQNLVRLIKEVDKDYMPVFFARKVVEAVEGRNDVGHALYNMFGFQLDSSYSPLSLLPSEYRFPLMKIDQAWNHFDGTTVLIEKPTEAQLRAQKQAQEKQAIRDAKEEESKRINRLLTKLERERLIELVPEGDENNNTIALWVNEDIKVADRKDDLWDFRKDMEVTNSGLKVGDIRVC